MAQSNRVVSVPDEDVDLRAWREKHAYHFASNQHVSQSPFAAYFGSYDRGTYLHIPPAGVQRDEMRAKAEKAEQRRRCNALKGDASKV